MAEKRNRNFATVVYPEFLLYHLFWLLSTLGGFFHG
nr:MAG TPA: Replication Initator RepB replication initiator, replication.8A [Inoviridae sp.]